MFCFLIVLLHDPVPWSLGFISDAILLIFLTKARPRSGSRINPSGPSESFVIIKVKFHRPLGLNTISISMCPLQSNQLTYQRCCLLFTLYIFNETETWKNFCKLKIVYTSIFMVYRYLYGNSVSVWYIGFCMVHRYLYGTSESAWYIGICMVYRYLYGKPVSV